FQGGKVFMSENKTPQTVENNLTLEQVKEELVETGKKSGVLAYEDVADRLSTFEIEPEQIDEFYEHLEEQGIDVIGDAEDEKALKEDVPTAEALRDLSVPLGVKINDPVRMYLKEIGRVDYYQQKKKWNLLKELKKMMKWQLET